MENMAMAVGNPTETLQERRTQTIPPASSGTERKVKKNLFLWFHEVTWGNSRQWVATRCHGRHTMFYVAEKVSLFQPLGSSETGRSETWMCEYVKKVFGNETETHFLVRPVLKTALVYGRERILTFHNANPHNGLPSWRHVEKPSEGIRVLYVPRREGNQPNTHSPRWLIKESFVCTCKQNGSFQVIVVDLIQEMPENFSSKERRGISRRKKRQQIRRYREKSKW